jgi:glycosyltransferase involved in cell wall biosynthesis
MPRSRRPSLRRVAFIGNSLPRLCGVATFTCDLADAVARCAPDTQVVIVPVNDVPEGYDYPPRVRFELEEKEIASYRRAASFLNIKDADVVSVQHEYGIYGGPAGSHLLALLRELRMPIVTTLHTVLREPDADQRAVMEALADLSDTLVVMTARAAAVLREVHAIPADRIAIIPHGIHDVPFVDPSFHKDEFGLEGRSVLLTFGLLGPGKGIEHAIEALPAIVERHPDTVYIILGATHPTLKRREGEVYRMRLQQLARDRGVEGNVIFHNCFVDLERLTEFLGAADLYITPYQNMAQAVSGTLAYAAGAGKAIVSTPYDHAAELLADDHGVLVPVRDPDALARAVNELLDDPVRRDAMRKRAYLRGRTMTWSRVATEYLETFQRARDARGHVPRAASELATLDRSPELPLLKLDHLRRMTDHTGILQHATCCVPNFDEGYATDDNARSLVFTMLASETGAFDASDLFQLGARYMSFLQYAYNPGPMRFRNFLNYDHRRWQEKIGSEDSHGRALWALGTVVAREPREGIREWAGQLVQNALRPVREFTSPRAWAFTLLGVAEYLQRYSGDSAAENTRRVLADRLMDAYRASCADDWWWFEDALSYCNAKLPHALLTTGRTTGRDDLLETGLEALEWLADVQRPEGHFVPIGSNGFYTRRGERARFDQQPVEAHAMVSACIEAYRVTGDTRWREEAQLVFDWFLGRNDLGLTVYDAGTGGCHDGLHPDRVNRNQGAESTLAFLLSLVEMRLADALVERPARPMVEATANNPAARSVVAGP